MSIEEGDRVILVLPGNHYDGRGGTVKKKKENQKNSYRRFYGIEVDGSDAKPWGDRLPYFEEHEIVASFR